MSPSDYVDNSAAPLSDIPILSHAAAKQGRDFAIFTGDTEGQSFDEPSPEETVIDVFGEIK